MAEAPARVFLSYSSADSGVVNALYDLMTQHRMADGSPALTVFQDEKKIGVGEDWKERLRSELRAADCVLLIWSKHSAGSAWALQEATYAAIEDKLTGLLIERAVTPPDLLSNSNARRYFAWPAAERNARIIQVCDELLDRTRARRGIVVDLDPEAEVTRVNREPQDLLVMDPSLRALHDKQPGCVFLLPAHDLEYPDEFARRYAHYVLPGALRQLPNGDALLKQYNPSVIEVFPKKRQGSVADLLESVDGQICDALDQPGSSLADCLRDATTLFPVLHVCLPVETWRAADAATLVAFIERLAALPSIDEPRRFFTVFVSLWYESAQPPTLPVKGRGLLGLFARRVGLDTCMRDLAARSSAFFVDPLDKIQWTDVSSWRDCYQDQLTESRFRSFRNRVRGPFQSADSTTRKHYADVVEPLTDALRDAITYHGGG